MEKETMWKTIRDRKDRSMEDRRQGRKPKTNMNRRSMKKETMWKTIAMAVVGIAAWAGEANAGNATGYVARSVPSGFSMMSVPFEQVGGGAQTLDSVFGNRLPDGSEIILFTPAGGFLTYAYVDGIGWVDAAVNPAGTTPLPRGIGFWVMNPASDAVKIVLRGQVPTLDRAVELAPGFQLVSFGFPLQTSPQLEAGLIPADGDELIAFGPVGFSTVAFVDGIGWLDAHAQPSTLVLEPGVAYWYMRVGAVTTWIQRKP